MKSIRDTLTLVSGIINEINKTVHINIALVGGYAVIIHGVARTTLDVDFLFYTEFSDEETVPFIDLFKHAVQPGRFDIEWVEGSRMIGEPFPYNILFLTDREGEYPRIDFIEARYKWELAGLKEASELEDVPFPVLPAPYLIAMKLKAGGPKDQSDIIELYKSLSKEERKKTKSLATLIKRDKTLDRLLFPKDISRVEPGDEELLIHSSK